MELSHATPARASWQCFTRDERIKLEALVDNYRRRHGPLVAWRLPTGPWAKAFGKHPSSVRRELARGKMRMGSEDTVVHYAYYAHLAEQAHVRAARRKGAPRLLETMPPCGTFQRGMDELRRLLARQSVLKATEGFYSIYAAIEVAKRRVPDFSVSENSIRNWLRDGMLAPLTPAKVAIWKRKSSAKGKKTTPHNVAAKRGHHLCDRPAEVDGLQVVGHCEGDTLVSCAGDLTALFSLLERISDYQWTRKMGRNTARCLHGALREIVRDGTVIRTVTFDNGSESEQVATLERILRDGGPPATRVFYADAYASNQRARNEKNHTFLRRFLGYGRLAKHSQGTIQHVTDFINDYPRKRFYGMSSREVLELLLQGISPPMRPKPLKKWERKKQPTRAFNLAIYDISPRA